MLLENEHAWWNLILWTTYTLLPSTWPKVYSKISLHNVFTGGDLERSEIYYTNIVVCKLFWRWEVKIRFLRNDVIHCIFIWLHSNIFKLEYRQHVSQAIKTYQRRPRGSRAFHLSSRTIIGKSSLWQTIPKKGYLCMLIGLEVYSVVTCLLSEN